MLIEDFLKGHYVVLGKKFESEENYLCLNKLNEHTDLKGQHNFILFSSFGLCHCSNFKQCCGDLIFFLEQLDYSVLLPP